jgi:hypothetical protein
MVRSRLSASVEAPTVDVIIDVGHPLPNYALDGFLKVGGVYLHVFCILDSLLSYETISSSTFWKHCYVTTTVQHVKMIMDLLIRVTCKV